MFHHLPATHYDLQPPLGYIVLAEPGPPPADLVALHQPLLLAYVLLLITSRAFPLLLRLLPCSTHGPQPASISYVCKKLGLADLVLLEMQFRGQLSTCGSDKPVPPRGIHPTQFSGLTTWSMLAGIMGWPSSWLILLASQPPTTSPTPLAASNPSVFRGLGTASPSSTLTGLAQATAHDPPSFPPLYPLPWLQSTLMLQHGWWGISTSSIAHWETDCLSPPPPPLRQTPLLQPSSQWPSPSIWMHTAPVTQQAAASPSTEAAVSPGSTASISPLVLSHSSIPAESLSHPMVTITRLTSFSSHPPLSILEAQAVDPSPIPSPPPHLPPPSLSSPHELCPMAYPSPLPNSSPGGPFSKLLIPNWQIHWPRRRPVPDQRQLCHYRWHKLPSTQL